MLPRALPIRNERGEAATNSRWLCNSFPLFPLTPWGSPLIINGVQDNLSVGLSEDSMSLSRRTLLAASSLLALPGFTARLIGQDTKAEPAKDPADPKKSGKDDAWNEFTPQSERAVRKGDEWLMKTMHRDGGCGVDIGQPTDIGCSSMVGLALMAQGNTPVEGPRSREVQRLVSFILRAAENMPQDDITAQQGTQLQNKIGRHAHSF